MNPKETDTSEHTQPNKIDLKRLDPTTNMNRQEIRRYGRMMKRAVGCFTKPSLGARTRKRRAVKKVGNRTRRLAR